MDADPCNILKFRTQAHPPGPDLSLAMPYLSKDLVDRALLGRDFGALVRILTIFGGISLASFALNAVSGLRYTRVSADILFDMRLALYTHLQRLSPRFYAHARLGDIMSRINNDIGEIQRIAAETALAWVGNVLFLAGSIAVAWWAGALTVVQVGLVAFLEGIMFTVFSAAEPAAVAHVVPASQLSAA